jgi:predicted kinase
MNRPVRATPWFETPATSAADLTHELRSVDRPLVLIVGPAASGKSTLARELATTPHQVLSLDGWRGAVSDDQTDQHATADAVDLLHRLADARLRRRLTTIIDATNVEDSARQPLLALARRRRVPAVAIVVVTPLAVCLERNARRPGPAADARWGLRVPEHLVRGQHDQLHDAITLLPREGFARLLAYTAA